MPYVSVDIDMSDLDTDDLVNELCRRLEKQNSRKSLSDKEKKQLKESLIELNEMLSLTPTESIEIKTLDDKLKYEHIAEVFTKYPLWEIQSKLP